MNNSIVMLKCKLSYQGETWHFNTNIECDKYFYTLEKNKWYEISLFEKSYGIKVNSDTTIYEMEYFILRHFYTESELRKEKIKTL